MTTILNKFKAFASSMLAVIFVLAFSVSACTSPEKAGEDTGDTTEEPAAAPEVEEASDEHPAGEHPAASDSTASEHPEGEHPSDDADDSESN